MKEIGKRMKELRENLGISQAVLAEYIHATQSSVNRYENGQTSPPIDYLRRFADFLMCLWITFSAERTSPRERPTLSIRPSHQTRKKCAGSSRCVLTQRPR